MREIKFSFMWQHQETGRWLDKRYTLESIIAGDPYEEFSDEPLYRGYHHVATREFIGLEDKNVVEIYEGDIIGGEWGEQQSEKPKEPFSARVVFVNGCFRLSWWMKNHTLEQADIGIKWREHFPYNPDVFYETTPLEVIGNIYENPELLGK